DEELGRQAFLQHLIRRTVRAGFPRSRIIWNTDELLLAAMQHLEDLTDGSRWPSISEMVHRYRLLEAPNRIARLDIDDPEHVRVLKLPQATAWIESELSSPTLETM